jgi:hypothetical protein
MLFAGALEAAGVGVDFEQPANTTVMVTITTKRIADTFFNIFFPPRTLLLAALCFSKENIKSLSGKL